MRRNDELRDETDRTDEEPTRVMSPAGEPVPHQRSAADEETMVFQPNGGDRTDDDSTVRTDVESTAADRPVGSADTDLDEDRPGVDRVTGESAGWGQPTSASGYDRGAETFDEPTAVGQAKVDRVEPDARADTVVEAPADDSPTVYESSAVQERTDDEQTTVEPLGDADETPRHAAEDTTPAPESDAAVVGGDLRPGDAPVAPVETLWGDGRSQEYRERWREVQLLFVDEPRAAAEQAESLVSDVVDAFTGALAAQRESLAGWQGADKNDTEELRVAVRRYREFLNRLLDL